MSVLMMPPSAPRHTVRPSSAAEGRRSGSAMAAAALPVALYLVFALGDLLCSEVAFAYGIAEGNPFMNWLLRMGLFVPGKILLSVVVAGVMAAAYRMSLRARVASWCGVAVTGAVVVYHLWALPQIISLASAAANSVHVG